ncbi:MAG TPA: protoporphyrinogen oxidase [Bryobacteraceae bacterium]
MEETPVVIVGGGISGLASAYFLGKAGIRSTIIEKAGRLGGLIGTDRIEDCVLEAGPDSYLGSKTAATELARELGLGNDIAGSNDAERRVYIVRRGRLVPLPRGMVFMAPSEWRPALASPLFSTATKLRFLREILARPRARAEDISVHDFVAAHFGEEVVHYLAEPLLAGVYGGAAEALSAASVLPRFLAYEREYGSLIRGVRRERRAREPGSLFLTFRHGMQQFSSALADAVAPFSHTVHAEAQTVEKRENSWRVQTPDASFEAAELILACPAHVSARLLRTAAPELARELAAIPYSSAILVTVVYPDTGIRHPLQGFGFLVPRAERKTIAAATWIHRKFPFRVPAGLAALRAFIVDPEAGRLAANSREELIRLVRADFKQILGIEAEPLFATVYSWPTSMPQYVVGHEARRKRITRLVEAELGLSLAGNAFGGVGIPDCIHLAQQVADTIFTRKTSSN